jgi:hypothetical protein
VNAEGKALAAKPEGPKEQEKGEEDGEDEEDGRKVKKAKF